MTDTNTPTADMETVTEQFEEFASGYADSVVHTPNAASVDADWYVRTNSLTNKSYPSVEEVAELDEYEIVGENSLGTGVYINYVGYAGLSQSSADDTSCEASAEAGVGQNDDRVHTFTSQTTVQWRPSEVPVVENEVEMGAAHGVIHTCPDDLRDLADEIEETMSQSLVDELIETGLSEGYEYRVDDNGVTITTPRGVTIDGDAVRAIVESDRFEVVDIPSTDYANAKLRVAESDSA